MRNVDIYGLIMVTSFMGGLLTFLGWVMKSQNAGDMINGFDARKYNKDKVSKIVGEDMLSTGILIILLGIIGIFFGSKIYNYITYGQIVIFIVGIIKSIYDMDKKCRKKDR